MNDLGNREVHELKFQIRYKKEGTDTWFYHMTAGYQYFIYVYDITSKYSQEKIGRKEYNSFKGDIFESGVYIYKYVKKYAVTVDPTNMIVIDTVYKNAQRLAYSLKDLSTGRYEVEIIRVSNYSEDTRTANQLTLDYINEIVYDDFTYPNVALLSVTAMATDQLSSLPRISALVENTTIAGTEKSKSNPAWACYDLLKREGIADKDIDLEKFQEWADYCDTEKFEVSLYLDTQQDLQTALNMISIIGRATVVQFGSKFSPLVENVVELPTQSFLFTSGNIIDSSFEMATIPYAERSNVVEVTYYDKDDDYNAKPEQEQSFDFDANTREIKSSISLYGCTNKEIAKRYAKFCLNKNRYITNTVSFSASVDSIACSIGEVIFVGVTGMTNTLADGRLNEVSGNFVSLDTFVSLEKDETYELQIRTEDDDLISFDYLHSADSTETDTLELAFFPEIENPLNIVYAFGKQVSKSTNMYRVLSITRDSDFKRKITAIEYNPSVYDDDVEIELEEMVSLPGVTNLIASEMLLTKIDGSIDEIIALSWEGNSLSYDIYLDGTKIASTDSNSYVIKDIFVKTKIYKIKVNDLQITHTYNGAGALLSTVQNVSSIYNNGVYTIIWDASADILFDYYEVVIGGVTYKTTNSFYEISTLANGIYEVLIYSINTLGEKSEATEYQLTIESKTIGTIALEADTKVNQVVVDMAQNIERLDATIEENSQNLVSTVETLTSSITTAEQSIDDLGVETLDNFALTEVKIQESKVIAQSANGKWEANAETLILGPDGKLTGIHAKANNDISEVVISADKFKIEDAIGTPFSVIDGEIYNNTKVNFSKNPKIATKEDLKDLSSISFIEDDIDDGVEFYQFGRSLNLFGTAVPSGEYTKKQSLRTKLSYENGAIFSWEHKKENHLGESPLRQGYSVNVKDGETNETVFASNVLLFNGAPFLVENEPFYGIWGDYYIKGLEEQYYIDNPTATAEEYNTYKAAYINKDGITREVNGAPIYYTTSFIYDDSNIIVFEDGLERFRIPLSSGRVLNVEISFPPTETITDENAPTESKYTHIYGSSLYLHKWDRYYNNTNLISEISELNTSLTALTSSTANEQFSLNNKILEETQERLNQDALLDLKVTDEETKRINALSALQVEYKNYQDIVLKALADEIITAEEQALISVAWDNVQLTKNQFTNLQTNINTLDEKVNQLTTVESISWQTEVQNAINNDLTTIDGGKIVAVEALVEKLNVLGGIIADSLNANAIISNTIDGSIINGARINGSVISTSYLDLDGELQVLTNYHISVATYNGNPSLYSDSVYISADNEYRIPSISIVRETTISKNMSVGAWLYGKIRAYNVANAGHNAKAVRINPTIDISTTFNILSTKVTLNNRSAPTGSSSFRVYVGSSYFTVTQGLSGAYMNNYGDDSNKWSNVESGSVVVNGYTMANDLRANSHTDKESTLSTVSNSATYSFTFNGVSFTASFLMYSTGVMILYIKVNAGSYPLASNFTSSYLFRTYCSSLAGNITHNTKSSLISSSVTINNMI